MDHLDLIESLWLAGDYDEGDALAEAFLGRTGRVVAYNPNQHPRDAYGKFAEVLGSLAPGDKASTPGGVTVTRTRHGYHVRAARTRDLDRRTHHKDPVEAAASALTLDQTPREPDRIGGLRHKKGAQLNRRDAGALPRGSAVVTSGGEFGRLVGVERAPGRASADRAVVEFDPRDPTRSSKPHRARVALDALSGAVALERDAEGAHPAPREESPGEIDAAIKGGLASAAKHLGMGPGGDAFHFLHDAEGALERATEKHPLRRTLARAEREARAQRSRNAATIASGRADLDAVERQLRHFGIVPQPAGPALPPARLRDGVRVPARSPGRARS